MQVPAQYAVLNGSTYAQGIYNATTFILPIEVQNNTVWLAEVHFYIEAGEWTFYSLGGYSESGECFRLVCLNSTGGVLLYFNRIL